MASGDRPQEDGAGEVQPAPFNLQSEAGQLRARLVAHLVREGVIRSPQLEEAFAAVPREFFLPGDIPLKKVYTDDAIVVKWDEQNQPTSSSTQPLLMADMLEALRLEPGQRVLEIGAGVGYNAAIMAYVLGDGACLTTVDLDPGMAEISRQNLERLAQYLGPSFGRVQVVAGDGSKGYDANAPYDRIIVTVQQWEISPAWVEQLKVGGLLLLPLTISRHLWGGLIPAFQKLSNGHLQAIAASHGGFMPMRGSMAHPVNLPHSEQGRLMELPLDPEEVLPGLEINEVLQDAGVPTRLFLSGPDFSPELINFFETADPPQVFAYDSYELDLSANAVQLAGSQAQRAAAQAYAGYSVALAVALHDRLYPMILVLPTLEQDGLQGMPGDPASVRIEDGWRYETRGLALLAERPGQVDLAAITANPPERRNWNKLAQGWQFAEQGKIPEPGQNRAMQKLLEAWQAWQQMGRPTPLDYRPLAYPRSEPPPAAGLVLERANYNLLLPFQESAG
ncbi:MAG TPA: hypothetical protein VH186_22505 [Chloroflexia bacterium]|nr:hypothetical protein [Chloroflexia bacterium]